MNSELQKCRAYYELLGGEAKQRKTAKHLLTAIQIAERYEASLVTIRDVACGESQCKQSAIIALARIAKPDVE